MTEWTCIECEGKYTDLSGDTDERICEECAEKKDHGEEIDSNVNELFSGIVNALSGKWTS